jgi:hypothetical protein
VVRTHDRRGAALSDVARRTRPDVAQGLSRALGKTFRGALPKQTMPYLSIPHTTVMGDGAGLREAVLLGRAWGMTNAYIVNTIVQSVHYYTGVERLNMVHEVLQDVL